MTVKANWKACKKNPRASAEKRFQRPQPLDAPTGCIHGSWMCATAQRSHVAEWLNADRSKRIVYRGTKNASMFMLTSPPYPAPPHSSSGCNLRLVKRVGLPENHPPPSLPSFFFCFNILIIDVLAGGVSRGYPHFRRFNAISRTWSESCATCSFSIPLPLHLLCVWFHATTTNSPLPISPPLISIPCKWFFFFFTPLLSGLGFDRRHKLSAHVAFRAHFNSAWHLCDSWNGHRWELGPHLVRERAQRAVIYLRSLISGWKTAFSQQRLFILHVIKCDRGVAVHLRLGYYWVTLAAFEEKKMLKLLL